MSAPILSPELAAEVERLEEAARRRGSLRALEETQQRERDLVRGKERALAGLDKVMGTKVRAQFMLTFSPVHDEHPDETIDVWLHHLILPAIVVTATKWGVLRDWRIVDYESRTDDLPLWSWSDALLRAHDLAVEQHGITYGTKESHHDDRPNG